ERIAFGAAGAHGFAESGSESIEHAKGCLGSTVARAHAGSAGGKNKSRPLRAPMLELRGDFSFVIRHEGTLNLCFWPMLAKQVDDRRARGIGHQALGAAVGNCEYAKEH